MSTYSNRAPIVLKTIFLLVLSGIAVLSISRGIFYSLITDPEALTGLSADIYRAFFVGFRFDLKVVAIGFAPALLAGLLMAIGKKSFALWQKGVPFYSVLIFFLLTGFSIGNYYYYVTYGSYFDIFAFGLFDDDTEAILQDAWRDYPILRSVLAAAAVAVVGFFLTKLWANKEGSWSAISSSKVVLTIAMVCFIAVYFISARGSVGSLPLKRYHANVSQYKPLNMITPNALMALDWAKNDYKEQATFDPISDEKVKAQMIKMLGQETPEYQLPENAFLQENPPHVVMALMEGLGSNVLIEDDKDSNDLLGSLRQHFDSDFVFKRFLAGTSATIDSIVMMLVHSDIATISHSGVRNVAIEGSAVLPYKRAGYDVFFIYGGNSMWRNLAGYMPVQGFDAVYDENDIITAFPGAKKYATTWGVPDEYTLKYAEKLLDEAKNPTLIYIMTATNHSPYEVPGDYKDGKPVKVSERLTEVMTSLSEQAPQMLGTYQYANDQLGKFVSRIKASDIGDKTIIAASGDHRIRAVNSSRKEEMGIANGVPFYLYVPQPILDNVEYTYEASRIGSHRDIFPTLYHFSLSDDKYVTLGGENMLSTEGVSELGYNSSSSINKQGAYLNGNSNNLYQWQGDSWLTEKQPVDNPTPEWGKEYRKLQNYYIRSQVAKD